jgi:hypothetical protein
MRHPVDYVVDRDGHNGRAVASTRQYCAQRARMLAQRLRRDWRVRRQHESVCGACVCGCYKAFVVAYVLQAVGFYVAYSVGAFTIVAGSNSGTNTSSTSMPVT